MHLAEAGPCTAAELSKSSELGRIQTYRVLQELLDKGLVTSSMERPRRFAAVELSAAVDQLTQESRKRLMDLEDKKSELLSQWTSRLGTAAPAKNAGFRIVHGTKNIIRLTQTLYESATKEIDFVLSPRHLLRATTYGLDDTLEGKSKEGVKVRGISNIGPEGLEAAKRFLEFCELRHNPSQGIAWMRLVDDRAVLVSLTDGGKGGVEKDVAIWTDSEDFLMITRRFFETLWLTSQDANDRIGEVETGKPLGETHYVKMGIRFSTNLPELVEATTTDLLLMTSVAGVVRLARDGYLAKAAKRGVRVRVMGNITELNLESALELSKYCEVRSIGLRFVEMAVSDGKVALGAVYDPSSLKDDEASLQEGFSSKSEAYLKMVRGVFMEMWEASLPIEARAAEMKAGAKMEALGSVGKPLLLQHLMRDYADALGDDAARAAMKRASASTVESQMKGTRWARLAGDPVGALHAFSRELQAGGAKTMITRREGKLELTVQGCKLGTAFREEPFLCELESVYLEALLKRTGAKSVVRTRCLADGDAACTYEVKTEEGPST